MFAHAMSRGALYNNVHAKAWLTQRAIACIAISTDRERNIREQANLGARLVPVLWFVFVRGITVWQLRNFGPISRKRLHSNEQQQRLHPAEGLEMGRAECAMAVLAYQSAHRRADT
jgi:hypothetical protein